jgi:hypothetical protein
MTDSSAPRPQTTRTWADVRAGVPKDEARIAAFRADLEQQAADAACPSPALPRFDPARDARRLRPAAARRAAIFDAAAGDGDSPPAVELGPRVPAALFDELAADPDKVAPAAAPDTVCPLGVAIAGWIEVGLTPEAATDLAALVAATELGRGELINRAIRHFWAAVDGEIFRSGGSPV